MAAVDGTKVIVTPFIDAPTPETGKVKEYGSGNEIRNGIPIPFGKDPTKFTCKLLSVSDSIIRNIKTLESETISVAFVNEKGQIVAKPTVAATGLPSSSPSGTDIYVGFPAYSFHVSDLNLGGLEAPDYHEITFQLKPDWSDYRKIITPTDFSALDL
jgi:hypothetical protein